MTDDQVKDFVTKLRQQASEANDNVEKYLSAKGPSSLLNDAVSTRNTLDYVADLLEEISNGTKL